MVSAMLMTLPMFLQLAATAAPAVAPETLAAFAQYESGLNSTALHDNTTGLTFKPATVEAASALASSLLAQGHSLDLGIMQVNSANLATVGLTVPAAFDPAQSVRAGAQILAAAFQQCRRKGLAEEQAALRCAASVYNTGSEQNGILNGYQAKVWRAAALLVPAIRTAATIPDQPAIAPDDVVAPQPRPRLPTLLEDALHPAPPVPSDDNGMHDAIHLPNATETP